MSTIARASIRTRVCCCDDALERREEPELLHQLRRVARPTLGHRAAAEHANAIRAIDGRDLANARPLLVVRVPVLHVMADRAVVHDVIQLDRAVVPHAQMPLDLRQCRLGRGGTT